ncbi:response regulator [Aggregatilinea lenta]|uniref:response regulator n=1 Tax=Aggregatilinea lenta TaxID=913108 RepID=UPI000E5BD3A4|nr:response regulator [Aggregatilinea lenta]
MEATATAQFFSQMKNGHGGGGEAILSSISEALFFVDKDGKVSYLNPRAEELIGVRAAEVIGSSYEFLFRQVASLSTNAQQTIDDLLSGVEKVQDKPTTHISVRYPHSAHLQVRLFPIQVTHDDKVEVEGWGGIIWDASPEWNKIGQRTKDIFLLASELRQSMVMIKGYVATLLSGHYYWGEVERREFLDNINDNLKQSIRLLENVREISKLELGEIELERRPADIKRMVELVAKKVASQNEKATFTIDIPDNLPPVKVDSLRIERVIYSLLDNAVKFSPREKEVRVAAQMLDTEIKLSIADRGMATPGDYLGDDYGSLHQVSTGNASPMRDLALELYVARGLLHAHGGQIWAETKPGEGTLVQIVLPVDMSNTSSSGPQTPVTEQAAISTQVQASADVRATPRPVNQSTAKVLVVEDDARMLRFLKMQLEIMGYKVITASEGSDALDLAALEVPDVVLLDIHLPDANGFDVCAQLREFTAVPIIMITGSAKEEDIVRGLGVGADDYLTKPFRNKELLARVQANLRRSYLTDKTHSDPLFRAGDLVIDFEQRLVTMRGKSINLTPIEYKLLYQLATNAGRILTHDQLVAKVWGPLFKEETQYLWVNISRLRSKIEKDPSEPEYILTERGVGYYFPSLDQITQSDATPNKMQPA